MSFKQIIKSVLAPALLLLTAVTIFTACGNNHSNDSNVSGYTDSSLIITSDTPKTTTEKADVTTTSPDSTDSLTQSTSSNDTTDKTDMITTTEKNDVTTTPSVDKIPETEKYPDFEVSAPVYALYDITSNELLTATDLDKVISPAGTIKLLTALTVLEYVSPDDKITVGRELSLVPSDASSANLKRGNVLTVRDALCGLLVKSGSDAAYTLAVNVGRIILSDPDCSDNDAFDAFIYAMNSYAKSIGMENTNIVLPDGYPDNDQYSTLYDMITLASKARSNSIIANIVDNASVNVESADGTTFNWTSSNKLIGKDSAFYYAFADGMSTGYSSSSGYCLIASAEMDSRTVVALIFEASNDSERYQNARSLLNKAYGIEVEKPINTTWIVDCNESISLRKAPNYESSTITGIKKGEMVTLINFTERFAYVQYDKKNSSGKVTKSYKGYVLAAYIVLPEEYSYKNDLDIVTPVEEYTYDQMLIDLAELAKKYPDRITLSSIGKSEEGRDLTLAIMGNPAAENHIFIQASIHAREHMTTTLVMAQMDYMLSHENTLYGNSGHTIGTLLDSTCFHIVPMANPDGVNIVQTGVLPAEFKGKYSSYEISQWKANAKGIDLNANFDGDWENHGDGSVTKPGPYDYKGSAPECAAEAKALADYIRANDFDITLSYHVTGSVIYYNYGNNEKINNLNLSLANRIYAVSGFEPSFQAGTSSAGLKDWAIDKLGIVSLTIEFGSFNPPLMMREFSNVWARGRDTLIISALWQLQQN